MSKKKKPAGPGKPRPAPKPSSGKQERFISIFIFAFAFLLYANTFRHGYVLDDDVVYLKNRLVQQGVGGIKDIFTHSFIYGFTGHNDQSYRPIVQVVYAFEKQLLGNNPHTQHVVNVALFALACLLLYKLLRRMLQDSPPWVPVASALLFAAHPIHTESVANIKGLDDILNFVFLIGSLICIFKHIDTGNRKYFFASLLFFFLSLLCKEVAITFVILIPLTVLFFTSVPFKKAIKGAFAFGGILLLYFMIRRAALDVITFEEKMNVLNNALAAAANSSDRMATALLMLGKYIGLLFFPHPLSFDYSFNQVPIVSFTDIKVIATVLVLAGLGIYAVVISWKMLKQKASVNIPGAKSHIPYLTSHILSYCILFFFISMSVVANIFILIGSTMGERFLFTPSFAFCLAVPFFIRRFGKNVFMGVTAIVLVLFSVKTFTRNKDWKSNFTLFLSAVDACPNSSRVQSSAGSAYQRQAEKEADPRKRVELFQKSVPYYEKALQILPDNTEALYNAGVSYYGAGDLDNALKVYQRALKILPAYTNAANNAGVIYFERKEYANAKKYFEQALQYAPNNSDALGNLGAINYNTGNPKAAMEYFKRALQIDPANKSVQANLQMAERAMQNNKQH